LWVEQHRKNCHIGIDPSSAVDWNLLGWRIGERGRELRCLVAAPAITPDCNPLAKVFPADFLQKLAKG
jgi:hypothetical protein